MSLSMDLAHKELICAILCLKVDILLNYYVSYA